MGSLLKVPHEVSVEWINQGEPINCIVDYYYYPAEPGDWDTPPYSEEVELVNVWYRDMSILELLSKCELDAIEDEIAEVGKLYYEDLYA